MCFSLFPPPYTLGPTCRSLFSLRSFLPSFAWDFTADRLKKLFRFSPRGPFFYVLALSVVEVGVDLSTFFSHGLLLVLSVPISLPFSPATISDRLYPV